jgi:hypothetical protein
MLLVSGTLIKQQLQQPIKWRKIEVESISDFVTVQLA